MALHVKRVLFLRAGVRPGSPGTTWECGLRCLPVTQWLAGPKGPEGRANTRDLGLEFTVGVWATCMAAAAHTGRGSAGRRQAPQVPREAPSREAQLAVTPVAQTPGPEKAEKENPPGVSGGPALTCAHTLRN